jgi:hypothetical protein
MNVQLATIEDLETVAGLFDQYRVFYLLARRSFAGGSGAKPLSRFSIY